MFLAFPEGKHCGSPAAVKPHAPEWVDLDHATRFPDAEAAARTFSEYFPGRWARVLTLREAWKLT